MKRVEKWIEDIWNNTHIKVRIGWCYGIIEDTELAEDLAYMDATYMAREYPNEYSTIMAEVEDKNTK